MKEAEKKKQMKQVNYGQMLITIDISFKIALFKAWAYKHKPQVHQDDTSSHSFFLRLCLCRPGSHVADACTCA